MKIFLFDDEKRKSVKKYVFHSIAIALLCNVICGIISGTLSDLSDVLELMITLPIVSVLVMIIRLMLTLFCKAFGIHSKPKVIILEYAIFLLIILAVGFVSRSMIEPCQDVVATSIVVVLDIIYCICLLFFIK